jgi:hypothetical protein
MTLSENIAKYESNVRNWTVGNLKADPDFMLLCREDEAFRCWVLSIKPGMANEKVSRMKFRRPDGIKAPMEGKTPTIAPQRVESEQVEELSKTGKIIKDLKAYRKDQGFI